MLFIDLELEIGSQEHNVVFGHIRIMFESQLEGFDFIRMKLEQSSKKLTKFPIVADPASPHLKNRLEPILQKPFITRINLLSPQFLEHFLIMLDKQYNKNIVIARLLSFRAQ